MALTDRGEVERSDTSAHAEGLQNAVRVDVVADALHGLAHHQCVGTRGVFDDFEAAQHITARIKLDLAGFEGDLLGNFVLQSSLMSSPPQCDTYHVRHESVAVSKHCARASGHGDLLPLRERA